MTAHLKSLPDPRQPAYAAKLSSSRADSGARRASDALQRIAAASTEWMAEALVHGDDATIVAAFSEARGDQEYRDLEQCLDRLFDTGAGQPMFLRLFALPIVFVSGGCEARMSGVVPEIPVLQKLLEDHGALGESKSLGLSNALVSAQQLGALKPSLLYRFATGNFAKDFAALELTPQAIDVTSGDEQVHLRFLLGASIGTPQMPTSSIRPANIGSWGMAFTKALAASLAQEGLSLLPIPRAPMSLYRALAAGRFAERELGFQLFLSNALKKFRASVGEPEASVAAFSDASVRVRLTSPFDTAKPEYFWRLDPGDDLAVVSTSILGLLEECRVMNVQVAETVQAGSASH
ncbi:MAG: hypothetical protein ABL878_14935 [Burkholderiales bacterium]